jgi:GTP-binding protein Era
MTRLKVTAVSPKRNTTRRQTIGVATEANTQVTLFDTPGINEIHEAKRYQRDLATAAWDAVADADLALVVMDAAKHMAGPELFLLHKCKQVAEMNPNMKWALVLNKVDLVEPKDSLITYLNRTLALMPFDDCFMISAVTGDGVADIENYLFNTAVPREWEHDSETRTDVSDIEHATEIIREVIYNRMNKEIPYAVQQQNVGWELLRNGDIRIDQRVIVRRQAHKEILVGMNGKTLRSITQTAAMNLENAFARKVHLYLRVNVNLNQDFNNS